MTDEYTRSKLQFRELDVGTWPAFVRLFGANGACGGCWCMHWRTTNADYQTMKGVGNKRAIHKLAKESFPLGVIAFHDEQPVGWCSVSPRNELPRLKSSRVLRPVDDEPVWSIVCLFILKPYRKKGLSAALISAATAFAAAQGAKIVEAYPISPTTEKFPDVFAFTGPMSAYVNAGFQEVARRSPTRPIMRKLVDGNGG